MEIISCSLRGDLAVVMSRMRTLLMICVASFLAVGLLAGNPIDQGSNHKKKSGERTVFVTGSLIPQRIKLKSIGTTTVSPVRIIDRHEIDATGRRTTRGALIADHSVSAVGH